MAGNALKVKIDATPGACSVRQHQGFLYPSFCGLLNANSLLCGRYFTGSNFMNNATKSEPLSRTVLIVLLVVCLAAIGAVVYLVVRPGAEPAENIITLIESKDAVDAGINVLHVIDAIENREAKAEEGRRYKVLIVDETKEGASGIARIGGLVTFVPNTRKGDVVVVEITRLKASTADATVVERLASGQVVPEMTRPARPVASDRPRADRSNPPTEMVGKIFRGTVTDVGREGDGVVKVDGKIVFVEGAAMGEHVEFKITDDAGRFARAEVISKSATPYETKSKREPRMDSASSEQAVQPVKVGEEHVVTITEADRRNPDVNGVARIENFVVFVPGTKLGDRVRIRITELRPRSAMSEVVERLEPEPAAP